MKWLAVLLLTLPAASPAAADAGPAAHWLGHGALLLTLDAQGAALGLYAPGTLGASQLAPGTHGWAPAPDDPPLVEAADSAPAARYFGYSQRLTASSLRIGWTVAPGGAAVATQRIGVGRAARAAHFQITPQPRAHAHAPAPLLQRLAEARTHVQTYTAEGLVLWTDSRFPELWLCAVASPGASFDLRRFGGNRGAQRTFGWTDADSQRVVHEVYLAVGASAADARRQAEAARDQGFEALATAASESLREQLAGVPAPVAPRLATVLAAYDTATAAYATGWRDGWFGQADWPRHSAWLVRARSTAAGHIDSAHWLRQARAYAPAVQPFRFPAAWGAEGVRVLPPIVRDVGAAAWWLAAGNHLAGRATEAQRARLAAQRDTVARVLDALTAWATLADEPAPYFVPRYGYDAAGPEQQLELLLGLAAGQNLYAALGGAPGPAWAYAQETLTNQLRLNTLHRGTPVGDPALAFWLRDVLPPEHPLWAAAPGGPRPAPAVVPAVPPETLVARLTEQRPDLMQSAPVRAAVLAVATMEQHYAPPSPR